VQRGGGEGKNTKEKEESSGGGKSGPLGHTALIKKTIRNSDIFERRKRKKRKTETLKRGCWAKSRNPTHHENGGKEDFGRREKKVKKRHFGKSQRLRDEKSSRREEKGARTLARAIWEAELT